MVRSEAQRTLIKSPLELWEELSDPASLARHLGEFGEIRITRSRQERTLEWEAESLAGTVELLPSGWGTHVTLTVAGPQRQDAQPEQTAGEPDPGEDRPLPAGEAPPEEPGSDEAPTAGREAGPAEDASTEDAGAPEKPAANVEDAAPPRAPDPTAPARRGFLARLFRRRPRRRSAGGDERVPEAPAGPVEAERAPEPSERAVRPAEPVAQAPEHPAPPPEPAGETPEAAPEAVAGDGERRVAIWLEEIEAECAAGEQTAAPAPAMTEEQAEAILQSVLDRLGSAHHRPFSRA